MKQQRAALQLLLIWAALSSFLLAVNASPAHAAALDSRGVRGGRGQLCRVKNMPHCNKGLVCNADKRCAEPGTLKTACSSDADCRTELFCGALARCATPRKLGKTCTRNGQCASKTCSSIYGRCVRASTSSVAPSSSSSSVPPSSLPTGTADTSSAAKTALASATPVSDSSAFVSNSLLKAPGQIKTFGSVAIVSTQLGPAIEAFAEPGKPAVLEQVLSTALSRRQQSDNLLSFNYDVTSFVTTGGSAGQCSIVPSINGNQLSPPIALTSASQSGTAAYHYAGAVTSYALALVCDSTSRARVQYDSISVSPSNSPSSSSSASSSSTTSSSASYSSTTSSSTTTSAPAVTVAPLPTGACTGVYDCGYESGFADVLPGYSTAILHCLVTDDPAYVHTGTYAQQCMINNTSYGVAYLDSERNYNFVPGKSYTVSFWAKFDNGAQADGLTCRVWVGFGDGGTQYRGKCPLTDAAPENGFYQFALPFTARDNYTSFDVSFNGTMPGTYTFDDVSFLEGMYDVKYATATPTATATYSYTPTLTPAPLPTGNQNCTAPFTNCGFEKGTLAGYSTFYSGHTACQIVTNSSGQVFDGLYSYKCRIADTVRNPSGGLELSLQGFNLNRGITYDFSFWSKNNNASDITCSNGRSNSTPYGNATMPIVVPATQATNGYSRYSTLVTEADLGSSYTISCQFTNPATYYFDDFALTPRTT